MAIAAKLIGTVQEPFQINTAPLNILNITIQGCGIQGIPLPIGNLVTAVQIVTAINSYLVGGTATVAIDNRIQISTNLSGSAASLLISGNQFALGSLGFLPPNNIASGSDEAAPIVLEIDPPCYLVIGGIEMKVTGQNFISGSSVIIGDQFVLQQLQFISSQELRGIIPPGQVGRYDVTVKNSDNQVGILQDAFSYVPVVAPKIVSVNPSTGFLFGGTEVEIIGTGFSFQMNFRFGAHDATDIIIISPILARCKTPAGDTLGKVDVVGTTFDQASTSLLEEGFTYVQAPVPDLASINPITGPLLGGINVHVFGSNFLEDVDVRFGVHSSTLVNFIDSQNLEALLPQGDVLGYVDVIITNPDGGQDKLISGFQYVNPPSAISIVPNEGLVSGGTPVTITGSGFQVGALVEFGGASARNIMVVDSTEIICKTPSHEEGIVDVSVMNPDTQVTILQDSFTYIPLSDHIQLDTGTLCGVQSFDAEVTSTLSGLVNCRNRAEQAAVKIDKRINPYGEPTSLTTDLLIGNREVGIEDSVFQLGDIVLVFDNLLPNGEALIINKIEPKLDGTTLIGFETNSLHTYTVAEGAKAKRYNKEYSDLNEVNTVISSFRDVDELFLVKDFLDAYVEFVDSNLDPNM